MPLMEISTARVIEEVERHPALWKTTDPHYKSKAFRHKEWQVIVRTMVPDFDKLPLAQKKDTDKAIQQRWKTARDAYMRNKALIKSGAIVKKYFYFDRLSFLDQCGPGWYEPKPQSEEGAALGTEPVTSSKMHQMLVVEPLSPSNSSTTPPPLSQLPAPQTVASNSTDPIGFHQVMVKEECVDNDDEYNENSYDASNLHTEIDIEDEFKEIPVEIQIPTAPLATTSNVKPKRAIKRKLVGNEINVEVYKMLKKTTKDIKDDNMAFFMSMMPIVNKFSDRRKLLFRSEVIRIAIELSSQDD